MATILRRTRRVKCLLLLTVPLLGWASGPVLAAHRQDAGGVYIGIGSGIIHSRNFAYQLAAPVCPHVEIHFSSWRDGNRRQAGGIGYRFDNGSPVSVLLGAAYIESITDNLLRHADAYVEVRLQVFEAVSCQISHYSTIGDDRGENFLLCGWQWRWPQAD